MFDANLRNVAAISTSQLLAVFERLEHLPLLGVLTSYPHLNLPGHFGFLGGLNDVVKEFKRRGEVELSSERELIGCR
jgi:hypothetical protein